MAPLGRLSLFSRLRVLHVLNFLLFMLLDAKKTRRATSECYWYEKAGNAASFFVSPPLLAARNSTTSLSRLHTELRFLKSLNSSRHISNHPKRFDITLITQLSQNRMYVIERMAQRWRGPMVFVVFLEKQTAVNNLANMIGSSPALLARRNIMYRIVFDSKHAQAVPGLYPTNTLRNAALNVVHTDYTLHLDADFLPNPNMYRSLQLQLRTFAEKGLYSYAKKRKRNYAFVIPAFEAVSHNSMSMQDYISKLPMTKANLIDAWLRRKEYDVFHNRTFPAGHSLTDSRRWAVATKPYTIKWKPGCYEPYVLIKTRKFPPFDRRFVGYHFNKIQHTFRLIAEDFKFVVLPHDFVVHVPHGSSRNVFANEPLRIRCLYFAAANFFRELSDKYGPRVGRYALPFSRYFKERISANVTSFDGRCMTLAVARGDVLRINGHLTKAAASRAMRPGTML